MWVIEGMLMVGHRGSVEIWSWRDFDGGLYRSFEGGSLTKC
jgi:hypothetical protein